ncbi:hypothetical protein [Eisenbergiella sp.]
MVIYGKKRQADMKKINIWYGMQKQNTRYGKLRKMQFFGCSARRTFLGEGVDFACKIP